MDIGETLADVMDACASADTKAPRIVTIVDGYVVDDATGEVHGLVEDCRLGGVIREGEYLFTPGPERETRFAVNSHESADWVLSKRMEEESALKSIEARRAAMNANFDHMAQVHKDRLRHLSHRFDAELENFAHANLPRGKKTLTLPHGSIAFRTIPATVQITDEYRAVQWADEAAPSIVRKSVSKTEVMNAWKNIQGVDADLPTFAQRIPARESVTIKTGL
jgi:hypothetical protein